MRGALLSSLSIVAVCFSMHDQPIMLDFNSLYLPTQLVYFDQACKQLWSDLDFVLDNPDLLQRDQTLAHGLFKQLTKVIERFQTMVSSEESRTYLKDDVEYALDCMTTIFEKYALLELQPEIDFAEWYGVALSACNQLQTRSFEI